MSEQKTVHITIFQAPFSSLMERGLYLKMYDPNHKFCEPVPAEYYLVAYDGEIEIPEHLPEDRKKRTHRLLEHVFSIFNTQHPAGYCGRSLSVGDVVRLAGKHYLCVTIGFEEVTFMASKSHPTANPTACPLKLPDGTALQVAVYGRTETTYPCINIDLIAANGERNRVCFVEHNPDKEPGHELCVGVYCAEDDETVYYNSYHLGEKSDG